MTDANWAQAYQKIVLFGDSITQQSLDAHHGWGALVAHQFQRECDVVRRGYSGYNTRQAKHCLPIIFNETELRDVLALTIFFGANDAALPPSVQHIDVAEYQINLSAMIDQFISLGVAVNRIILISPPPIDDARREERRNAVAKTYADAALSVAVQRGVKSINLWQTIQDKHPHDWSACLHDGLHLGPLGCAVLGDLVIGKIQQIVKETGRPLLPVLPAWRDFDPEHPELLLQRKAVVDLP